MAWSARRTALANGFRSGLEEDVASSLQARGVPYLFETVTLHYCVPESCHRYTPDFKIKCASGKEVLIETKGRWLPADRKKMKLVIEQHPDLDIRMVFNNPNQRITKTSKTTYAAWCDRHLGIPWAKGDIPDAWILE